MRCYGLVLIAACGGGTAPALPDAAAPTPDAPYVDRSCHDVNLTPIAITGTSPVGSLDKYKFAMVGYVTGFCQPSYVINLRPDDLGTCDPWGQLYIPYGFGPGSHPASIQDGGDTTSNVTFEATALDEPMAGSAHVTGHFVSHDPAWSFDIAVDLIDSVDTDCI